MRLSGWRAVAACLAVTAAACSSEQPSRPARPPAGAKRVDAGQAGRVTGRVTFEGIPPANGPIKMSGDAFCARENQNGATFESVMVADGGLDNVFVYVKEGLDGYWFETPADPVKLDQKGCRYTPHVVGLRVGQPLLIVNSDPTLHNVHAVPQKNQEFNLGQHVQGMSNTKTFTAPEVMVPFKCDVHGWMSAFVGVVDHPYFAVSARGGRFDLNDLPAGTYTVEAWHEKLGTRTERVTIAEKEAKTVAFSFSAGS